MDNPIIRKVCVALIVFPAVYLLWGMMYGAITYPYWDHVELIDWFVRYYEGTLSFGDLFAAHNHSRPATYRALMLGSGILTGWNLRVEYVYLYLSLVFGFVAHLHYIKKLNHGTSWSSLKLLIPAAVFSIFYFSPVAHHNHWWSMMFQLTFTNLLIVIALAKIAHSPESLRHQIAAVILSVLAVFTLTNGLIVMALAIGLHLLFTNRKYKWKMVALWSVALVATLYVYFVSLGGLETGSGQTPTLKNFVSFVLLYFGAPLSGLISFPFNDHLHMPNDRVAALRNGFWGFVILVSIITILVRQRRSIATDLRTRYLAVFFLFVLGSAVVTAWGRSEFGGAGYSNANASRYVIFSSYSLYGLIYYLSGRSFGDCACWGKTFSKNIQIRLAWGLALVFLWVSAVTYCHGLSVFDTARRHNIKLKLAFASEEGFEQYHKDLYPNKERALYLREKLREFELGPYGQIDPERRRFESSYRVKKN